jgi:Skp family chaperone for outer membrane proteins
MKFVKFFVLSLSLLVAAGAFSAYAASQDAKIKIAYVDLAKIFDQYEKTKAYDGVLKADNDKFQEERNKKIEKVRDLQGKLAMLKDDEKTKSEQQIEVLKNEIMEFDRAKKTDLAKTRDEKVREILLEIEKTVGEYAKAQSLTFVLNDRVLIYGDQTMNITEVILKKLNEAYAKAKK